MKVRCILLAFLPQQDSSSVNTVMTSWMPMVKFQIEQIAQYFFQENTHVQVNIYFPSFAVPKLGKYIFYSHSFIFKPIQITNYML